MKKMIMFIVLILICSSMTLGYDIICFSGQVGDIPEPAFEEDTSDSSSFSGSSSSSSSRSSSSGKSSSSSREEEIVYVGGEDNTENTNKPKEEVEVNVFKGNVKPSVQKINSIMPILAGVLIGLCLVISGLGVYIIKRKLNE